MSNDAKPPASRSCPCGPRPTATTWRSWGEGSRGSRSAIQLKKARPETSVVVLEKREGPAPLAAFKVGESTVPAGAHYFAKVVGMETTSSSVS